MENLFMFLATSLVLRINTPKFKRYLIGKRGCSAILLKGNNTLHYKHTREGDKVYFYDHTVNEVTFGLIAVQMKESYASAQAENILVHYINRIRKPFGIAVNTGMEIQQKSGIITITDYWQDEKGCDWKINGQTNGKTLAVLYVKNIGDSLTHEQETFLNGFRFSASA